MIGASISGSVNVKPVPDDNCEIVQEVARLLVAQEERLNERFFSLEKLHREHAKITTEFAKGFVHTNYRSSDGSASLDPVAADIPDDANYMDEEYHLQHANYMPTTITRVRASHLQASGASKVAENFAMGLAKTKSTMPSDVPASYYRSKSHGHGLLSFVVTHQVFDYVTTCMILLSAVNMTVSLEVALRDWTEPWSLLAVEIVCCVFFTLEVALHIAYWRAEFVFGRGRWWNLFYCVVVVCGWGHLILTLFPLDLHTIHVLLFARLLRLVRILRISRLAKVMKSQQETKLVLSLMRCIWRSIAPTFVITLICTYVVTMSILALVVDYLLLDPEPAVERGLQTYWGSVSLALRSMYEAVSYGRPWSEMAGSLHDSSSASYTLFVLYMACFQFLVANIIIATFVQLTMKFMRNAGRLSLEAKLSHRFEFVQTLREVYGSNLISFEVFCQGLDCETMETVLRQLEVSNTDAEQLFYSMSGQGERLVEIDRFVSGCIQMMQGVTKVDMLQLQDAVQGARQIQFATGRCVGADTTLEELSGKQEVVVEEVSESTFADRLTDVGMKNMMQFDQEHEEFKETVREVVTVALNCTGGCGFVIASHAAYKAVREQQVDFQCVDHRAEFPKGYMTERLRDVHVSDPFFMQTMREFSAHSDTDAWPLNHEAGGLPKDGYTLLSLKGFRVIAAARIQGLPVSPFKWDGVGTRHSAALNVCWVLRSFPAVVIVRSDRGDVHGLYHSRGDVVVLRCVY